MRVLLVEDDPAFGVILQGAFSQGPYVTEWVGDGLQAATRARTESYDLILLDLGLPGCDGFEVCRRLRSGKVDTPVIVVTGRSELRDRVTSLDCGADDLIVKPIEVAELLARVRAVTRRGRSALLACVHHCGTLALDSVTNTFTLAGAPLVLTPTEYRLLECLVKRCGTIVSRKELIQHVWGGFLQARSNSPEVYISYLRAKLAGGGPHVCTVRGIGYMLTSEEPAPGSRDGH